MKISRKNLRKLITEEVGLLNERGMVGNVSVPGVDPATSQAVVSAIYANPDLELWLKADLDAQRASYQGQIEMLREAGRGLVKSYNAIAEEMGMESIHMPVFDDTGAHRPPPGSGGVYSPMDPMDE